MPIAVTALGKSLNKKNGGLGPPLFYYILRFKD